MLILLQNEFWRKKKEGEKSPRADPQMKFDVMEFLFSYKEAAERLCSIEKTMDL